MIGWRCRFGLHRPERKTVERAGRTYIGLCRFCRKPIHRLMHKIWLSGYS